MDLLQEIEQLYSQLELSISTARKYDLEYAERERLYRMELSKRLVELRAHGQAVTHLADIARGEKNIADLRYKRDIAEGMRNSARETINYLKLKLRCLDAQLQREWGNTRT